MKSNVKYEYVLLNKNTGVIEDILSTRADARYSKNDLKEYSVDTKIIQNVYELKESKEVR